MRVDEYGVVSGYPLGVPLISATKIGGTFDGYPLVAPYLLFQNDESIHPFLESYDYCIWKKQITITIVQYFFFSID